MIPCWHQQSSGRDLDPWPGRQMRMRWSAVQLAACALLQLTGFAAAQPDPTAAMYDPTRVIAVDITIDPDRWDRLRAQERTFVSLFSGECLDQPFDNPFTYFPADVTIDGQLHTMSGFARGLPWLTQYGSKPGLKIDLTEFSPTAPFTASRSSRSTTQSRIRLSSGSVSAISYSSVQVFRLRDAISQMSR